MAKKQDKADDAPDFIGDGFDEYGGTNLDLPDFGVGGNIFTTPTDLLGGAATTIGADAASGFLSGAVPTFTAPATSISFNAPGSMAPGGMSLGDLINPWAQRTDITQLAPGWGTWNPTTDVTTAADFSGVKLTGTPFSNVGIDQTAITGGQPTVTAGSNISTTASEGGAVQLDPFEVTGTRVQTGPVVNLSDIYTPRITGGEGLLGGVSTSGADTGAVQLDPVFVEAIKSRRPTLTTTTVTPTTGATGGSTTGYTTDESGAIVLDPVTVSGTRVNPNVGTLNWDEYQQGIQQAWNKNNPVVLPAVKVTPTDDQTTDTTGTTITQTGVRRFDPTRTLGDTIKTGISIEGVPGESMVPDTGFKPGPTPSTNITQSGTTATSTTTTSSAMTERDLKEELKKTMAAFGEYRPQIQQMYGDLYQQFMPKGLTAAEPGIINQYQADLARLQQRQAGMLSPEDIRQSQQSAREAYGARGQVMGPGAIGAEILNREAIRQQREDQARAALQSSYGNILNMANLQTGNLFSPIASLMSSTFNPLGAYPADVYGTNVNAQLARDIAQKNYEAAIRSAELSGAAQKSAATTSAAGNVFGPALGAAATKGISVIFATVGIPPLSCMPGDQCIDTPTGPRAVKDLKGGDAVIGYDGEVAYIAQACSWNQDPLRTFLTITREDGSSFTVCDDHKVMGIPAMEWVEGADLAGSKITSIKPSTGLLTSYDILTNQGGYRINGVPVNSMIPEIIMQVVEFHRQVDRNLQAASA